MRYLKNKQKKFNLKYSSFDTHFFYKQHFYKQHVIVQRVKVSVAIVNDLNLLPYQTTIIQWRNFNKDMYKL